MNIPNFLLTLANPKQLQKIDRYLLLNYPRFWVTKVHYVIAVFSRIRGNKILERFTVQDCNTPHSRDYRYIYYGLLVNIILNLFVFVVINPKVIDEFIQYFIVLTMLIEAGIFIFWFVKQSVYNVEKEYGNTSSGIGLVEILVYTLCAVIITSSSLTMTATAIYRIASLVEMKPSTECSSVIKFFETDANNYNNDVCLGMRAFLGGYNHYNYYLPYEVHWWFHTIFLMLAIFLLVIRKYSNWVTLSWIGFYLLCLMSASIFSWIVLSNLRFIGSISGDFDEFESTWLIIFGMLTILLFFQSIRLTKIRRFNNFKFINFAILPIALGVLISVIVFFLPNTSFITMNIALLIFFIFYISVFPFYKAILNRTLALPKE